MATAIASRNLVPTDPTDPRRCFGDFGQCIAKVLNARPHHPMWNGSEDAPSIQRDRAEKRLLEVYWRDKNAPIRKYMGESTGAGGGYLVPPEYAWGLMRDVAEEAIFWKRAYVQRMASQTVELSLPDPTTSAGVQQVTNLIGSIRMKWMQQPEAAANETEPKFRSVELQSYMLSGIAYSSNELIQDYQGLDDFLRNTYTRAVEWYTDQAFFQGVGPPGSPLGIVNAPGTIQQARATASTVAQTDLANMMQQLLPASWSRAIWAVSSTALQNIMNLTGLGGILYFIPGEDGSIGMLFGCPIYVTEKLPALGTTGDVCLFDPALYVIGHRDLLIDYSDQGPDVFPQNQAAWRTTWRGDGTPALQSSVTLANQSSTKASPYVVLKA